MEMRAEYDHQNNRVVAVQMDDGRVTSTHNPRVLGAETQWLPVAIEYPEGYDQRFNMLLDPGNVEYAFDSDGQRILVRYPNADFSPRAIRAQIQLHIRDAAKYVLDRTDWYLIRRLETGAEVPQEVLADRQAIRAKADAYMVELAQLADADLSDFTFTFGFDDRDRERAVPVESVEGGDGTEWVTDATAPGQRGKPVEPAADRAEQPIRPFSSEATYGTADKIEPSDPGSGMPWELGEGPDGPGGQ